VADIVAVHHLFIRSCCSQRSTDRRCSLQTIGAKKKRPVARLLDARTGTLPSGRTLSIVAGVITACGHHGSDVYFVGWVSRAGRSVRAADVRMETRFRALSAFWIFRERVMVSSRARVCVETQIHRFMCLFDWSRQTPSAGPAR